MTRPEFERQLSRLRERIAEVPPAQRAGLERLVAETAERHETIVRHSLLARRAVERLELAFERLGDAFRVLERRSEEARRALADTRPARPGPGLS